MNFNLPKETTDAEVIEETKHIDQMDTKNLIITAEKYVAASLFDEAIKTYLGGIRSDENNPSLWYNIANVYYKCGNYKEARRCWEQSIKLSPGFSYSHYNLALCCYMLKDYETAIKNLNIVGENEPNFKEGSVWYQLGLIHDEMNRGKKAIEYYKKTLDINPNYAEAWNNLGSVYFDQGRFTKAEKCYQSAIAVNDKFIDAIRNLGCVYANLNKPRKLKDILNSLRLLDTKEADLFEQDLIAAEKLP